MNLAQELRAIATPYTNKLIEEDKIRALLRKYGRVVMIVDICLRDQAKMGKYSYTMHTSKSLHNVDNLDDIKTIYEYKGLKCTVDNGFITFEW